MEAKRVEVEPRAWRNTARELIDDVVREVVLGFFVVLAIGLTLFEMVVSLVVGDEGGCSMSQIPQHEIVEGAVVHLKSGGPNMTVSEPPTKDREGAVRVQCVWFTEAGEFRNGSFRAAALKVGPA